MKELKSRNAVRTLICSLVQKIGERELINKLVGTMGLTELNDKLGFVCWTCEIEYNEDGEIIEQ